MSKSKGNRRVRQELERIYGKGCFFHRAHVAERIEAMGGIKSFKVFVKEKRYKGKPISHQITLHHLKHRSEHGRTTVENGANVEEIAHQYLHSLPRDQEEIINNMLREFKINCIAMTPEGEVQGAKSIEMDLGEDVLVIPVFDNDENCKPDIEKKFEQVEEVLQLRDEIQVERERKTKEQKQQEKRYRLTHQSRAMKKRELQKLIDEEEEEWEI